MTKQKFPNWHRQATQECQYNITLHHNQYVDTVAVHIHQDSVQHMARCAQSVARLAISAENAEENQTINEIEQETIQENIGEDFETVSNNSVYFNKNHSILMANLKTLVGKNSMSIPYKLDMGSIGNIMPWHIFKKLFPGVTDVWLVETVNKHYS